MSIFNRSGNTLPCQQRGRIAENLACRWLKAKGLTIEQRNYRCRYGELDIVAWEKSVLVFIEVRYRQHRRGLTSIDTLDYKKLGNLYACIDHYLQNRSISTIQDWRLDALGMEGILKNPSYDWIKDIRV